MNHLTLFSRLICASALTLLSACASTNFDVEQEPGFAIPVSDNTRLGRHYRQRQRELITGESVFFPLAAGSDALAARLRLITNSLASTNHVPVHAAYARYRKGLLTMGAQLYETRGDAFQVRNPEDDRPLRTTLHTKLIVIDRRYVFIGSLNLDPRSVVINTELGIMIDSRDLALELLSDIGDGLNDEAYRVELLAEHDRVLWHGLEQGRMKTFDREPGTSWWRRFSVNLFSLLPEGQL